jgi:hypothetical protein
MKRRIFQLLMALLVSQSVVSQRLLPYKAFKRGEYLNYSVRYGFVEAGEASIRVTEDNLKFADRSTFHVVGTGKTASTFDWFFKVRDRYESYVDENTLLPEFFVRKVDEGGFIINQKYRFYQNNKNVRASRDGTDKPRNITDKYFNVPAKTHDILSAFYFARNADFGAIEAGKVLNVVTFFDEELFPMQLKIIGKEVIKTDAGKIRCIKLRPLLQKGRVFKEEEDLTVWVSDDRNRIPVRLQAEVLVGSIKMDLKNYENLAHPLAFSK